MLEHGGRLRAAAAHYDIPLADWLDLSTGINPQAYPVGPIDPACWNRLPEDDDGLEAAAAAYYGNSRLLALPGSQAAIQGLPALFRPVAIGCLAPLYEEHPQAWEKAGFRLRRLPTLARLLAAMTPIVLLCNPNNPTAVALPRNVLIEAAEQLQRRGGWLIVDEAFGDPEPENSLTPLAGSDDAPNLLVLRSLGKFFGLAGARVGFLFGAEDKLAQLREKLGPWPLSNPSRLAARQALTDLAWHAATRARLATDSRRLATLLEPLGEVSRTALFCTVRNADSAVLAEHFATRAILVRHYGETPFLRFGLPDSEHSWQRLAQAVRDFANSCPA